MRETKARITRSSRGEVRVQARESFAQIFRMSVEANDDGGEGGI